MKATLTALVLMLFLVSPLMPMTALGAPENNTGPSRSQPQPALASLSSPAIPASATVISKPKILDFFADWCAPCQKLKPIIEKARAKYKGKVEFLTVDINNPAASELMKQYNVSSVPTLIFLDSKGNLVSFSSGYTGSESVHWGIKQLLKQNQQQQ